MCWMLCNVIIIIFIVVVLFVLVVLRLNKELKELKLFSSKTYCKLCNLEISTTRTRRWNVKQTWLCQLACEFWNRKATKSHVWNRNKFPTKSFSYMIFHHQHLPRRLLSFVSHSLSHSLARLLAVSVIPISIWWRIKLLKWKSVVMIM